MMNQYHWLNLSSVGVKKTDNFMYPCIVSDKMMDAEEDQFELDMDIVETPLSRPRTIPRDKETLTECVQELFNRDSKNLSPEESGKVKEVRIKYNEITFLIKKAYVSQCSATYQWCYPEIPMLRHESCVISDLSMMRIRYWNNSILLINQGLPLAVKCPTDIKLDYLISEMEGEIFVLVVTKEEEVNITWDEMTIHCPM